MQFNQALGNLFCSALELFLYILAFLYLGNYLFCFEITSKIRKN